MARIDAAANRFGHRTGDVQSESGTGSAAAVLVGSLKKAIEVSQ
jgi:hypothetical protein